MAYPYNSFDVGVLQEKLASFAMKLIIHQVQESEKQKVDKVEGGAPAGPAATPSQPVSQHISDNVHEPQHRLGPLHWPSKYKKTTSAYESHTKFLWWPTLTRNIQRKEFWEIEINLGKLIYYKATTPFKIGFTIFLRTLPQKSALSNPPYFRITSPSF